VIDARSYLGAHAELVERALDETVGDDGGRLLGAMRYALLGGGKGIRPVLLLASAEAVGADWRPLMPFACAVEMIHAYSLVHDDLPAMDDDELRRGRPTVHVQYGEALAILAGDGLLTDAFLVMAGAAEASPRQPAALRAIGEIAAAAGAHGMVAGQADDITAEGSDADLERVESIHRRKTGALLRAAVSAGAILGGAGEADLVRLGEYGASLGLAFQVVDDVLDATASSETTGKVGGRDRERGKRTYVELLGVEGARQRAVDLRRRSLASIASLGPSADALRAIADFVVERALRRVSGGERRS